LNKVRKIRFHIHIESDEYLRYYQGLADKVRLVADNGQVVMFPANRLKPFLTHDGITGHFEMQFDQNNKFISIRQLPR